ncbi:MAG: hypothetical protein ACI87A_002141, partial [Planctomycetota bacterium]
KIRIRCQTPYPYFEQQILPWHRFAVWWRQIA